MGSRSTLLIMSVKRRVAMLGVAAAAVLAMPASIVLGAWLGGDIRVQPERAISLATTISTVVLWLGVFRLMIALLVFSKAVSDQQ